MFDFHFVAKNIKGWLKIYTLFLVCSQIWLNLPTRWSPHFLHLHMDENQFGYKQKNPTKNNTVCSRCWNPPGNQSSQTDRRRAAGKRAKIVNTWFMTVLRKKVLDNWTGSGIPAPSNATSVHFWQKHAAPTLQRSASIRPKGISIEYADLMHFWWSFLFVGLLHAFAIPRLLQARLGKFDQLLT
jgi:hypothetical protein